MTFVPVYVKCLRCGHEWPPRLPKLPRRCPSCATSKPFEVKRD